MAKVSTADFKIDGKYYYLNVYYTKKEGFFIKDFPEQIKPFISHGFHDSERNMLHHYQRCIREYHELKQDSKKMLRINFKASTEFLMNKSEDGNFYSGSRFGLPMELHQKFISDLGTKGFHFDFDVVIAKEKNGTEIWTTDKNHNPINKLRSDLHRILLIPYSKESEEFLLSVKNAIDNLVGGLVKFFASENLEQKIIEQTGKFLLSNSIQQNDKD